MYNELSDFPADALIIVAQCDCGHRGDDDITALPQETTMDELAARLRSMFCTLAGTNKAVKLADRIFEAPINMHLFDSERFIIITALSALLFAVLTFLLVKFPREFHLIAIEDGPIESLTAAMFLLAGVGFIVAGIRSQYLKAQNTKSAYIMVGVWATLSFFAAGEEVSWGQRIIGTELPEFMQVEERFRSDGLFTNVQNETNFHNLGLVTDTVGTWRLAMVAGLGTAIVLPLLTLSSALSGLLRKYYVPVPPIDYWLLGVGSFLFVKYGKPFAHLENDLVETFEMIVSVIFLCFACFAAMRPNSIFVRNGTR